jgi:FkbM family methyltransferase
MTRRRAMFTVNGVRLVMDFDLASGVQKCMAEDLLDGGRYEPASSAYMERTVKPGDTVIDVGAHIGYFTLLLAALVGPKGRVFAFEPHPDNYQRLLQHLAINGLTNVTPFHMAVGHKCGVVDLWVNRDNDGGHALFDVGMIAANTKSAAHPQRYPVWMTTLDTVCPTHAALMKMDIEGSEHNVMKGCTLGPRVIVSEINRPGLVAMGTSEDTYRRYMETRGYQSWMPKPDGSLVDATGKSIIENYVFNLVFAGATDAA